MLKPWSSHRNKLPLVLAVASTATIVVLFTPLPDLQFASCDRPCHELDWPMICRFKLTLELHQTMSGLCQDCPRNVSHCFQHGCVVGDGTQRKIMTVNKQLPGPSIQVCQNDILVVDVINRIPGHNVAIHWRGQHQRESPYMDGVPMVTQCPAPSYTTFQYKFRASQAGTHLWQAHTGNELLDGMFGSLIVRRAKKVEEQRHLYDIDDPKHVLIINEWGNSEFAGLEGMEEPKILINGIGVRPDLVSPSLIVTPGVRYRIRMVNAGSSQGCPFYVSIQDHSLLVIAVDGKPVVPERTLRIKFNQGERVDFVLHANQLPQVYWLKVVSDCTKSVGHVKIEYKSSEGIIPSIKKKISAGNQGSNMNELLSTNHCGSGISGTCRAQIRSLKQMPNSLKNNVDLKLYLPFDYVKISDKEEDFVPRLNNITFMFPPSPLISQRHDFVDNIVCSAEKKPNRCKQGSLICECAHIIDIPLGSSVEVVLIDKVQGSAQDHLFHLHGYSFYVVGSTENLGDIKLDKIKKLDSKGMLMDRNIKDPLIKDTVSVPRGGAVAIRFEANNPGYWLLHDESPHLWTRGLAVVFNVGKDRDLPASPDSFPHCGSWVGPDFFLI